VSERSVSETLTHIGDRDARAPGSPVDFLYLALECERPLGRSARYALGSVDEVVIGRADERSVKRITENGLRRLHIGVPDRWMSGTHARLVRSLDTWLVEDAKSKNGTFVNEAPVKRVELEDGDVLEAGHTLFVFRAAQAIEATHDVDAVTLPLPAPGLRTLLPSLAADYERLQKVAGSAVSVVVHGESGTGKELAARAVHLLSGRSGPFIAVNCGALPKTLVETELFGYKKGAFSGATEDRPGLLRSAHRGTLFLDEIGDLPASAQPAFLRVLQEHEVVPVGAVQPVSVDVRLVAATHRDLDGLVQSGEFRGDLLARLSGFTLTLPPLRARREEIGIIVADLLERAQPNDAASVRFTLDAARALLFYDWPLNVRELEKCIAAAVVLAGREPIRPEHLPEAVRRRPAPDPVPVMASPHADPEPDDGAPPLRPLTDAELRHRDELVAVLREHGGNISAVARALGKARMQVQRWVKRYDLDPESFRN
jgi:DNA-binding NtrC family response regulator